MQKSFIVTIVLVLGIAVFFSTINDQSRLAGKQSSLTGKQAVRIAPQQAKVDPPHIICTSPINIYFGGEDPDISGRNVVFTAYFSGLSFMREIYLKDLGPDHIGGTPDDGGVSKISSAINNSQTARYPRIDGNKIIWIEDGNTFQDIMIYSLGQDGVFSSDDVGPISVYSSTNVLSDHIIKKDLLVFKETIGGISTPQNIYYCLSNDETNGCFMRKIQQLHHPLNKDMPRAIGFLDTIGSINFIIEEINNQQTDIVLYDSQGNLFTLTNNSEYDFLSDTYVYNQPTQFITYSPYPSSTFIGGQPMLVLSTNPNLEIPLLKQMFNGYSQRASPVRITKTLGQKTELLIAWDDGPGRDMFVTDFVLALNQYYFLLKDAARPAVDDNTLVYEDLRSLNLITRECEKV